MLTLRGWPGSEGQWNCVSPQGPTALVPLPLPSFLPAAEMEGEVGTPSPQGRFLGPQHEQGWRTWHRHFCGLWPPSTGVPTGFVCFEPQSLSPRVSGPAPRSQDGPRNEGGSNPMITPSPQRGAWPRGGGCQVSFPGLWCHLPASAFLRRLPGTPSVPVQTSWGGGGSSPWSRQGRHI